MVNHRRKGLKMPEYPMEWDGEWIEELTSISRKKKIRNAYLPIVPLWESLKKGVTMKDVALQQSIDHHRKNLANLVIAKDYIERVHIEADTCPLCKEHNGICSRCPVDKRSNGGCTGSPWIDLKRTLPTLKRTIRDTVVAEDAEIAFLESLKEKPRQVIHTGQRWSNSGCESVLAWVGGHLVQLVGLSGHDNGGAPQRVVDSDNITDEEWSRICDTPENWTLTTDK